MIMLSDYLGVLFIAYLNPILSFFSVILNIFTIMALLSKSIKKELRKQYFFLIIYTTSNLLFTITIPMSLVNYCQNEKVFCSSLYGYSWLSYFKMINTVLLRNILTTFSNLTYLTFLLMRYINISSTKNFVLQKLNKISLKTYFLAVGLLSLLSNAYIYFEIKVNKNLKYYSNFDMTTDLFKTDFSDFEYKLFISLQYLKLFLVDLLFFILSIVIDVTLIFFIKKSMNKSSHNRELKKSCKQRVLQMIILNGINFCLLKMPSRLIDFYALFFNFETRDTVTKYMPNFVSYLVCRNFSFCESLDEVFNFLILFSFIIQFFIFYKMDTNFKKAFKNVLSFKKETNT